LVVRHSLGAATPSPTDGRLQFARSRIRESARNTDEERTTMSFRARGQHDVAGQTRTAKPVCARCEPAHTVVCDDPADTQAKVRPAQSEAKWKDYIRRVVDNAPPLTEEQRARLTAIAILAAAGTTVPVTSADQRAA
jgi:hypothetical protein